MALVIKTDRDRDQYVIWGTRVDDVIAGPGDREQAAEYLMNQAEVRCHPHQAEDVLARVDTNGSSDRSFQFAWWDDDVLPVGDGYLLRRGRLAAYADAIGEGDWELAAALLERSDEE